MELHDLVLAKCAAGRDRDWEYAAIALSAELVSLATLVQRIPTMPVTAAEQRLIAARLQASASPDRESVPLPPEA